MLGHASQEGGGMRALASGCHHRSWGCLRRTARTHAGHACALARCAAGPRESANAALATMRGATKTPVLVREIVCVQ